MDELEHAHVLAIDQLQRPTVVMLRKRRLRLAWHRVGRRLNLSQKFLIAAFATVTASTLVIGLWAGSIVQANVLYGVAQAANSSIQSLIYPSVKDLVVDRQLPPAEIARLDDVFETTRESSSTRLMQFALLRLDGSQLYVADGGLVDTVSADLVARARGGQLTASLDTVVPEPIGPFTGFGLTVLRIVAPVSDPQGRPLLVAVLYLSARDLTDLTARTQQNIWILILIVGGLVILALYLLVDRATRTIIDQRRRLASNLAASRVLTDENRRLREASEALRLEASRANETLLGQVGSDIHDGPVQLLTLLILKLSGGQGGGTEINSPASIAQSAMDELRNISTGLVLPELADLTLQDTIRLAASRHERMTGVSVEIDVEAPALTPSMAVKICTYRVIQESLNNGFRHGGSDPTITMRTADSVVEVSITSDLPSFPTQRQTSGERLGLIGMRLRVEALGGVISVSFDATSAVRFRLPLSLAAAASQLEPLAAVPPGPDAEH